MSYLPYRDHPALHAVTERQQGLIFDLADRLETQARQAYHDSECCCSPGSGNFANCFYGASYPSVSADEIIAQLLVEGRLAPEGLNP